MKKLIFILLFFPCYLYSQDVPAQRIRVDTIKAFKGDTIHVKSLERHWRPVKFDSTLTLGIRLDTAYSWYPKLGDTTITGAPTITGIANGFQWDLPFPRMKSISWVTGLQDSLTSMKHKNDSTNAVSGFTTLYQNSLKLPISDTASMLSPYARILDLDIDTTLGDTWGWDGATLNVPTTRIAMLDRANTFTRAQTIDTLNSTGSVTTLGSYYLTRSNDVSGVLFQGGSLANELRNARIEFYPYNHSAASFRGKIESSSSNFFFATGAYNQDLRNYISAFDSNGALLVGRYINGVSIATYNGYKMRVGGSAYIDSFLTVNGNLSTTTISNRTIGLGGFFYTIGNLNGSTIVTNGNVEAALPTLPGPTSITNTRCTSAQSTTVSHSTSNSVKVTSDGTASNNFYTRYNSTGGQQPGSTTSLWYVSVWVYLPSGQSGFTTLSLLNKVGGAEVTLQTTNLTNQWVLLRGEFTPNHTAGDFYAAVRTNSITNPTGFFFYWDDLVIQPVTLTKNVGIGTSLPQENVSVYVPTPTFNMTSTTKNTNVSTHAQAKDTSAIYFEHTTVGENPYFGIVNNVGQTTLSFDSLDFAVGAQATSAQLILGKNVPLRANLLNLQDYAGTSREKTDSSGNKTMSGWGQFTVAYGTDTIKAGTVSDPVWSYCLPGGVWVQSSGESLKENIKLYGARLENFKYVSPRTFNFKEENFYQTFDEKSVPDSVDIEIDSVTTRRISNKAVKDAARSKFIADNLVDAKRRAAIPFVGLLSNEFNSWMLGKSSKDLNSADVTSVMWMKIQELEAEIALLKK